MGKGQHGLSHRTIRAAAAPGRASPGRKDAAQSLAELSERFPEDIKYEVSLDTTLAVTEGINEIVKTLEEAMLLVILVVFIFLQNWRATLIPLITVPVSLIGTFMVFPLLGFSVNVLSLLGLVLAIGIVVDDSIVVVEAVMHHIERGKSPREATIQAMKEVSGPVIAIALILCAVFIPVAMVPGITGRLYQQFAITIAVSVVFSAFSALSLSPALASILLKPSKPMSERKGLLNKFFNGFNRIFDNITGKYVGLAGFLSRKAMRVVIILVIVIASAGLLGKNLPGGFVPDEDQGYFLINVALPPASSLQRTDEVIRQAEAMAADVVVINHHLFFADINVRESGVAELLPTVHSVVFDEAHQLNEIGVQFMGRQLTIAQLNRYANDLASFASHRDLVIGNWGEVVDELKRRISGQNALCRTGEGFLRQAWFEDQPPGVEAQAWASTLQTLHAVLQQVEMVLRSVEDLSPDGKGLRERASQLMTELDVFSCPVQQGWVRWIEGGERVKLVQSPLDIADTMLSRVIPVDPVGEGRRSLIFTSATLGHDATLVQFLDSCGLQGAEVLQVESPFNYKSQAAIYVPEHMPKPSAVTHSDSVADLIAKSAAILGGRTLVLTTTVRAMRDIAEKLRQHFSRQCDIQVLLQGESSKRELTDRFRRAPDDAVKGTVLVATASFWEGVDVPGDALQLVVIDKLPFPPPNDPLVAARSRNIEARGKSAFQYMHVPQAAIAMRQGAGRLIRRETDRGILVVCDVRLSQMGYGRRILAALPPMQTINSEEEFIQALSALTKPSTMDH